MNSKDNKSKDYYSIGEVSRELDLEQHVVRFWTNRFSNYIKPTVKAGNRRYYNRQDIAKLYHIRTLLKERGISIKGVQLLIQEKQNLEDIAPSKQTTTVDQINQEQLQDMISQVEKMLQYIKDLEV